MFEKGFMKKFRFDMKIVERLQGHRGFSFPELLVTLLIFTFLAAALNTTLLAGSASWQTSSVEVELQQDLRQAMYHMKRSMQQTGSASLNDSVLGVSINGTPDSGTYHADEDCYLLASPSPACDPAYAWTTYTSVTFEEVLGVNDGVIDWADDISTDATSPTQFFVGEDLDGDGNLDAGEDINGNGVLDVPEDVNDNDVLDSGEDVNGNGLLDAGAPFQRIQGTTAVLIAENIESMQFRRLLASSDVVEVILKAQKSTLGGAQGRPIMLTLDAKFQMRN